MNDMDIPELMLIAFLIIPFGIMCWMGIIALGINVWVWAKQELGL